MVAAPYLVGFVPEDSIVLVALYGRQPRGRVVGTARADLVPDPVTVLRGFIRQALDRGAGSVIALVYDDPVSGPPLVRGGLVAALGRGLVEAGLPLVDALSVRREREGWRWWSYLCQRPDCCPTEGRLVSEESWIAAEAVGRGLVALPSRRDLVDALLPDESAVSAVSAEVPRWLTQVSTEAAWRSAQMLSIDTALADFAAVGGQGSDDGGLGTTSSRWGRVPAAQAARHLVALREVGVRDLVVVQPQSATLEAAARYWCELTRCAPVELRAPAATLLAVACIQQGAGARANVAVDVALAADPQYTLAQLLALAMGPGALSPDQLVQSLAEARVTERERLQRRLRGT